MQKNSYLLHSNHHVHDKQLSKLQGAFMPNISDMGTSETCKAFCSWPTGCLLLHRHKPANTTGPLQIQACDIRGLWKTGRDGVQRVKSGTVTNSRGRAKNRSFLTQASVCHSGVPTVTAKPHLSTWRDEAALSLSVKQWLKKMLSHTPNLAAKSRNDTGEVAALWIPDTGRVHHPSYAAAGLKAQRELHNA